MLNENPEQPDLLTEIEEAKKRVLSPPIVPAILSERTIALIKLIATVDVLVEHVASLEERLSGTGEST